MDFNTPTTENKQESMVMTECSIAFLRETGKWAKFLSILGFIASVFMFLFALLMFASGSVSAFLPSELSGAGAGGVQVLVAFVYIVLAVIYVFPAYYMYKFSVLAASACEMRDSNQLEQSLSNLKSLFKFSGILSIVVLAIYVLIIVFAIIAAMLSFSF